MHTDNQKVTFFLKAFHFFYYLGLGTTAPVLTIWYQKIHHFNGYEIALLTAVAPIGSIISMNFLGIIIDLLRRFRSILFVLLTASAISLISLYFIASFWGLFLLIAIFSFFSVPIISIMNSSLLHYYGTDSFKQFGDIRSYGTLGFLFANLFISAIIPPENISLFLFFHAGALLGCAAMLPLLPPIRAEFKGTNLRAIWHGLRHPLLARLALALILQQIAFSSIDNYVSIYITESGGSARTAALAWGSGVLLEFFILRQSTRFIERFSIRAFILIGIAATIFRLTLYFFQLPLWAIFIVQTTHALAFSGSYFGAVYYIGRIINPHARTSSQTAFDAFVRRGGMIIGSLMGGAIYEAMGVHNLFGIMAIIALASLLLVRFWIPVEEKSSVPI